MEISISDATADMTTVKSAKRWKGSFMDETLRARDGYRKKLDQIRTDA